MTPDPEFVEPQYTGGDFEDPGFVQPEFDAADAAAAPSLACRLTQVVFYGGAALALGLMLAINVSPTFAARVGEVIPTPLASLAGVEPTTSCASRADAPCGVCPMTASAATSSPGCCASSAAPVLASSDSGCCSDETAMMARTEEKSCCSSLSRTALLAGSAAEDEAAEDEVTLAVPTADEVFTGGL